MLKSIRFLPMPLYHIFILSLKSLPHHRSNFVTTPLLPLSYISENWISHHCLCSSMVYGLSPIPFLLVKIFYLPTDSLLAL